MTRTKAETNINISCDEKLQAAVRKAATRQDRSVSALCRAAIWQYLASISASTKAKAQPESSATA